MNREFKYAFPKTVPVMVGYIFLGAAYGVLMKINGFGIGWVLASSLIIYAGSLQYLEVTLLAGLVNPIYSFLMGLMINARHLFYGISMLSKYGGLKKWKTYLIYTLTDETFSIVVDLDIPEGMREENVCLFISLLDQFYWVFGSVFGVLLGSLITFDTTGLDFALTALFVSIFTDQWKKNKDHRPALTGLICSALCVVIFGADLFIIPAMIVIIAALSLGYRNEGRTGKAGESV